MLFPWNTNAPIYHVPAATIGLVLVNTAIYFAAADVDPDDFKHWTLVFGDGLHPLQWLTTNFLHADLWHLLGNMVFLWSFGLVVEGQLGWRRFLPLYLAMGIVYGMLLQLAMLGGEGSALGASGVIYSLLAIAMIWAPNSELSCVLLIDRPRPVEISIYVFAILYLTFELVLACFNEFAMGSEILHLTGAAIGAVVGVALLKGGFVDCDGHDLFNVIAGREGEPPIERHERVAAPAPIDREFQIADAERQIQECLTAGHAATAYKLAQLTGRHIPGWELPEPELLAIIRLFQRERQWQGAIAPMVEHLKRFPENSAAMRLKLAQILVVDQHRPYRALAVLAKLGGDSLSVEQTQLRAKLTALAEKQLEDADLEVAEDEDW